MAGSRNQRSSWTAPNPIVRPLWGSGELDVDRVAATRGASTLRARNTMLTVTLVLALAIGAVWVWGSSTVAGNLAILFLAPLAFVLVIIQAAVLVTRR